MTSAPITPISNLYTVGVSKSAEMASVNSTDNSFAKAMENSAEKSVSTSDNKVKEIDDKKTVDNSDRKVPERNRDNIKQNLNDNNKSIEAKDTKEIAESIEDKADGIKNTIKDKLGISDENLIRPWKCWD